MRSVLFALAAILAVSVSVASCQPPGMICDGNRCYFPGAAARIQAAQPQVRVYSRAVVRQRFSGPVRNLLCRLADRIRARRAT